MNPERFVSYLIKPLIKTGVYKNESMALKDLLLTHIQNKIEGYDKTIRALQSEHGMNFDSFSDQIRNKATMESEDDWMEWKSAIEMKHAWSRALKEVMQVEVKV